MRKAEAFAELELPETASQDECKKAFKRLAVKYHPDVNKDSGAETKFKRVNEAFQAIDSNNFSDNPVSFGGMPFGGGFGFNINDLFDSFGFGQKSNKNRQSAPPKDIHVNQTITFKESVLGCKKDITYTCDIMCEKCHGDGDILVDNGCKICKGKGRISGQQGRMFFERPCNVCKGQVKHEACSTCSSHGKLPSERTITASIKPGITDGTVLRMAGVGNFSAPYGGGHVFVSVKVISDPDLIINGEDVVTQVHISLLEALMGCKKEIKTIDGKQEIDIVAPFKNKDEVILPKLGISRTGNERVIVHIDYPEQLDQLINVLKQEKDK